MCLCVPEIPRFLIGRGLLFVSVSNHWDILYWPLGKQCGKAEGARRILWFLNALLTLCYSGGMAVIRGFAKSSVYQSLLLQESGAVLMSHSCGACGGYMIRTVILGRREKTAPPLTFPILKTSAPPHFQLLLP